MSSLLLLLARGRGAGVSPTPIGQSWADDTFWKGGVGWVDSNAPEAVAVGDAAFAGSAPITIDLAANDIYIGTGDPSTWRSQLEYRFYTAGTLGSGIVSNGDGTCNYQPPSGYTGPDSFQYDFRNPTINPDYSNKVTVSITVNNPPADAYYNTVFAIDDPVAYWRLGDPNVTSLTDSSGNGFHGGFPQAPVAFEQPGLTWDESDDKCIDFGGLGYAQIADDPAFHLAEGSLSFIFMATAAAIQAGGGLAMKDIAGTTTPDGMYCHLEPIPNALTITGRIKLAFQTAAGETAIYTPTSTEVEALPGGNGGVFGMIEPNRAHHVVVMWNTERVILVVDGRRVALSEAHTSGLVANTQAWQFARRPNGALGDVRLDEVVLYDRMLSSEEIDDLFEAQRRLISYDPNMDPSPTQADNTNFQALINAAVPGEIIELTTGNYAAAVFQNVAGTRANPIVVRPANLGARPVVTGQWIVTGCSWLVLDGMDSNGGRLFMQGESHHVRATRWSTPDLDQPSIFEVFDATDWRIDHCELAGREDTTANRRFIRLDDDAAYDGDLRRGLIDHLYVHDITPATGANGQELLNVGVTKSVAAFGEIVIEYSLFANISLPSEAEVITFKMSGGIMRYCTFDDLLGTGHAGRDMYVQMRRSLNWTWESNWWEDTDVPGAIVLGRDNFVVGNRIAGVGALGIQRGDEYSQAQLDDPQAGGGYAAAEHCLVVGNVTGAGQLIVGDHIQGGGITGAPALNNYLEANSVAPTLVTETNTTVSATTSEVWTAAVKLTAANVGRAGPAHPRTPAGWV